MFPRFQVFQGELFTGCRSLYHKTFYSIVIRFFKLLLA
jgi:hypothetical protein